MAIYGPDEPLTAAKLLKDAMDSGFSPVKLRALRETRLREMERNRDQEADSQATTARYQDSLKFQTPEERTRARMMQWGTPDTVTSAATRSDVRNLRQDLEDDPDTGAEAQDRTARIARTLDTAATTQRQEVGDAIDLTSRRNAFGDFLKAKGVTQGKYAADISPEGSEALDAASGRRRSELGIAAAGRLGHGGVPVAALRPGDDPLEGLSAQEQEFIKGLTEYKQPIPTGSALGKPEWVDRLGRAKLLDPTFDATQYPSRQKMRSDFAAGKSGQNIQALGTIQEHLDALEKKAAALDNYSSPTVNKFKNWWDKTVSGGAAVPGYEFDQGAVADEFAAALKATGATDQEIRGWTERLGSSSSPDQFKEIFKSGRDLIAARLKVQGERYDAGMGKPDAFRQFMEGKRARAAGETAPETKVFTTGPSAGKTGIKQPDGTWLIQ